MNQSKIQNRLGELLREQLTLTITLLLTPHFNPVFGASKLIEHEVAALEVLNKNWLNISISR